MDEPRILKGAAGKWPALLRSEQQWVDLFASTKPLKFRIGRKSQKRGEIQWENSCQHVQATIGQFFDWSRDSKGVSAGENPLVDGFDKSLHWAYLGYQYIFDLFDENSEIIDELDWKSFGLERDGWQSTLWIGSQAAYTPCHYDSYGFNLAVQIRGRKLWTLFPPDAPKNCMNPTRLPYEESSVFAAVDLFSMSEISVQKTTPRMVVLEPGDLLYVPRHWWHFVQCLDDQCISVNTWVDVKDDSEEKVNEAITHCLISLVKNQCQNSLIDCDWSLENSIECLNYASKNLNFNSNPEGDEFLIKFHEKFQNRLKSIPIASFQTYCELLGLNAKNFTENPNQTTNHTQNISKDDLLNVLLDRSIVTMIKLSLLKKSITD